MRLLAPLMILPLLAGCGSSEWDYLTSFGSPARASAARPAAAAQPAPQAAAARGPAQPDPFCLGVAKNDATTGDFDQATQGKVALRSYQQCVGIFGATATR